MDSNRRARLESLLKEELSRIISRELRDPRVPPLTVTAIEIASDASAATVFVLPFGILEDAPGREEKMANCLEGLESAAGFLKRHIARAIQIKQIPNLKFREDKGIANSVIVHSLLGKITIPSKDSLDSSIDPSPDSDTESSEDGNSKE